MLLLALEVFGKLKIQNYLGSIFDDENSYSIGCITIDSSNPEIIWVGTGENVGGRCRVMVMEYINQLMMEKLGLIWDLKHLNIFRKL